MDFEHFLAKLVGADWDKISLKHGKHKVCIKTNCHPHAVWVKVISHGGHHACCHNPLNYVAYKTSCHGICFFADIQTEGATIEWFALDKGTCECCCCKAGKCCCENKCC